MSTDERWKAAVHEAGHAVVAYDKGLESVSIAIDEAGMGWHEVPPAFFSLSRDTCQHLIPAHLTMAYAGEAAERMQFGSAPASECDRKLIVLLIGLVDPPSRELPDECRWRAEAILRDRRHALIALARVLERRGSMAGSQISEVLQDCWEAPV